MAYDSATSKIYKALATQTSTNAPVATVFNNTSGATVTPARVSAGLYTLTFSSAVLTANKTTMTLSNPLATLVGFWYVVTSTTVITFTTGLLTAGVLVPTDTLLTNTEIIIEIQN